MNKALKTLLEKLNFKTVPIYGENIPLSQALKTMTTDLLDEFGEGFVIMAPTTFGHTLLKLKGKDDLRSQKHAYVDTICEKLCNSSDIYPLLELLGRFPMNKKNSSEILSFEQILDGLSRYQATYFQPKEIILKDEKMSSKKSKLKNFRLNLTNSMNNSLNPISNCAYQCNKQRIKMAVEWFFNDHILNGTKPNLFGFFSHGW